MKYYYTVTRYVYSKPDIAIYNENWGIFIDLEKIKQDWIPIENPKNWVSTSGKPFKNRKVNLVNFHGIKKLLILEGCFTPIPKHLLKNT